MQLLLLVIVLSMYKEYEEERRKYGNDIIGKSNGSLVL